MKTTEIDVRSPKATWKVKNSEYGFGRKRKARGEQKVLLDEKNEELGVKQNKSDKKRSNKNAENGNRKRLKIQINAKNKSKTQ